MLAKLWMGLKVLECDERGQGMVEYALVIAFVAVVVIGAVTLFGTELQGLFTTITNAI